MALTSEQLRQGFLAGDRLVEPALNRIRGPAGVAQVEPRVMAVLVCLAEHAGEVVSRDALYEAVWGKAVVSDQALTNCISELRQHFGDDRAQPRYIQTVTKRGYRLVAAIGPAGADSKPERTGRPARATGRRVPLAITALAALGAAGALGLFLWWSLPGTDRSTTPATVVVLPFANAGDEERLDYLRLALPDEITTLLTASHDLVVRPFEHDAEGPPLDVGRARNARHVITGHYYLEPNDRLTVAVEAQEVDGERLVWRARFSVPANDLLAMRERISERVRRGLLPVLGAAAPAVSPQPADREAYDQYLRSLALPRHPESTVIAVAMLERAVALDPGFAPAWTALGERSYAHGSFGDGGEAARERARFAWQQALELDPEAISAAVGIIKLRTENGSLGEAYREARGLVQRFGGNAEAHLALAYVYKYGGMLEAAQRQCESAYARDPHNPLLRSCGYAFLYAGKLDRAQVFLDTDAGSYYSYWGTVLVNLRRADDAAALFAARQAPPDRYTRRLMVPCLQGRRGAALDDEAAGFVTYWSTRRDPEFAFGLAPMLAYCGRHAEALGFLERATERNFCGWPALDQDSIWEGLRERPEFRRLRDEAIACHRRFREIVESSQEPAL